jgi:hypothetical protein
MAHDHNDIYSIVERLRVLEEGLDKNQRGVNQLSATFKPKTVAVLTAPKDPKNPMAGKLVGGCEESIHEDEVAEDTLSKAKASLADYLKGVEEKYRDSHLKDKAKDRDIGSRDKRDRDLITKEDAEPGELGSALSGVIPAEQPPGEPGVSMKESAVKTVTNECGIWEMYGDEKTGFEIRHGNRTLPSRFKNLEEAELALEMFNLRRRKRDEAQDYIDEA